MAKRRRHDNHFLLIPGEQAAGPKATYVIDSLVGLGSFGAVYAAHDPALPGRKVALKEFFPVRHPRDREAQDELFRRESYVGRLASPHTLMPTLYDAFTFDSRYYIAQEYIEGVTLAEIIVMRHPLSRDWILKWAVSLCDALAFLHSRGIVHHDLKPANIRISPLGQLTLLDFGAAQYFGEGFEDEEPPELYGTEGYLPPELDTDGDWVADVRTDIFALGCILYEMITGHPPDQDAINARSMYVANALMQRKDLDLNLVKLINTALSYNTDFRYATANDLLLELRKLSPPVLLVNKKHLRFGQIGPNEPVPAQRIMLYNAGGGTMSGEIKSRTPWLAPDTVTFAGDQKMLTVKVDPAQIKERGQVVTGRLEIFSPDVRDAEGKLIMSGDRRFVECSILLTRRPALLVVRERKTSDAPPIALTGRRGQSASGTFQLKNYGEEEAEWECEPPPGLTLSPAAGRLQEREAVTITVTLEPSASVSGLTITTRAGQRVPVPLTLRVESPLDTLKRRMGGRAT